MLKEYSKIITVSFAFLVFVHSNRAIAGDPCESQFRSGCGRLVISLLGAGEVRETDKPADDGTVWDSIGTQSGEHLKQFSPTKTNIPVQAIAISSDPDFNKVAPSLFEVKNANFLGTEPNSIETLKNEILSGSDKSKIQRAIKNFENDPECQRLKKERNMDSVLPLIKVEVLVDGEYAESEGRPALPSWRNSKDLGTAAEWKQDKTFLQKSEWDKLMGLLSGAVVQTFVTTCKGAKLASYFEQESSQSSCSCFIAGTARDQDDYTTGGAASTWNYAIPDNGVANSTSHKLNNWNGAYNLASMVPDIYKKNSGLIFFNPRVDGNDPLNAVTLTYKRNPLMGFVYTSADTLAEDALKQLPESSQILNAQFTSELPALAPIAADNTELVRVNEQINDLERSYQPVFDESANRLSSSVFDKEFANFADCANGIPIVGANPKKIDCAALKIMFAQVYENPKGQAEQDYVSAKTNLSVTLKGNNVRELWKSYIGKKVPLGTVFNGLAQIWKSYELYRDNLVAVTFKKSGGYRTVTPAIEVAVNHMTESFERAFDSVRSQVFNELRREAMQVKIARMRQAVNGVVKNADSLPAGYADKFLKDMSSKLNCLTQFAVGPKFDENRPGKLPLPVFVKSKDGDHEKAEGIR